MSVAERAVGMIVVPVIATIPVSVHRAAVPAVPPVRVVTPVPRRAPANPERIPEPVVDVGTIDIHGLNDVVSAVDIFITDHLRGDLAGGLIFLHVDRCYILEHILSQYGLDNDKMFVIGRGLHYA